MQNILLISPYWKEDHRWMVSSYKLAELWQRLGYKVTVVCMSSHSDIEQVSDTLTIHHRKDIFLPDPLNFGIAFGLAGYVRRLVKQQKPDLIVVNKVLFWTSFALIPLRLTGHRILLLTDAFVGMSWWPRGFIPKIIMGLGAWTVGWLVMLCSSRMVTFFPQSPKLLGFLGIKKKTQVIPTGIDPAPFAREPKEDASQITATYIGRLESVKGVDDFLGALSSLRKEYPALNLQVVGWYKNDHPLVAEYEDQVIFTGLRDDIPEILENTDIFVMPSYSEGLSNGLMEAMASSCACVASDVGGNRYLIQNGVSGFLFDPGDREALRAHVKRLIEDPAKRVAIGKAARERIEQFFSWDKVGKQYKALFDDFLSKS